MLSLILGFKSSSFFIFTCSVDVLEIVKRAQGDPFKCPNCLRIGTAGNCSFPR